MGDSITAQANAPDGYIGLVIYGLKVEGVDATAIPAGVPGHTSGNMRARVDPQILGQGANWMTLSCGVNDVKMQSKGRGVDLESFKKNVTAMVEAAIAKSVKVVLLTATPLGEDLENPENQQLAPYNDFLRNYAKEKNLVLADVNAAFRDYLKANPVPPDATVRPGSRLLADGLHPNKVGQALMAKTLLTAMGVPASDLPKIEKAWMENPVGKEMKLSGGIHVLISQNQYLALVQLSKGHPGAVPSMLVPLWDRALKDSSPAEGAGTSSYPAKTTEAAQARLGPLVDEFIKKSASP